MNGEAQAPSQLKQGQARGRWLLCLSGGLWRCRQKCLGLANKVGRRDGVGGGKGRWIRVLVKVHEVWVLKVMGRRLMIQGRSLPGAESEACGGIRWGAADGTLVEPAPAVAGCEVLAPWEGLLQRARGSQRRGDKFWDRGLQECCHSREATVRGVACAHVV